MLRQLFLPLGLLLAVFSAILLPAGGIFLAENYGPRILVILIFLVSGYQTGSKALSLDRKLLSIFWLAAAISLLLAPLLGLLFSKILVLPPYLALGLIVIASVPPTISSGVVITEVSGGNTVLALFLTIGLNLLGIFTMPFVLALCLKATGPIDIDQTALLLKMLLFVLLPFLLGKMVRTLSRRKQVSPLWSYLNSGCVILMVYSSIAISRDGFAGLGPSTYAQVLAAVALIHILLLTINHRTGKLLHLPPGDRKALTFVTSQKTLAIGLAVLTNLQFDTGNALIVCLFFHFFQLFLDSFLASAMRNRQAGEPSV
ncbi:MAG: bile acid:sodium symporter [Thermodesulfobacteriota bacterium]